MFFCFVLGFGGFKYFFKQNSISCLLHAGQIKNKTATLVSVCADSFFKPDTRERKRERDGGGGGGRRETCTSKGDIMNTMNIHQVRLFLTCALCHKWHVKRRCL